MFSYALISIVIYSMKNSERINVYLGPVPFDALKEKVYPKMTYKFVKFEQEVTCKHREPPLLMQFWLNYPFNVDLQSCSLCLDASLRACRVSNLSFMIQRVLAVVCSMCPLLNCHVRHLKQSRGLLHVYK